MPPCMGLGQAAGAAAALALQTNTDVRTLDTAALRNVLREQKVLLDV